MNLKFANFELGFWQLDFEIKNFNFIKLRYGYNLKFRNWGITILKLET